MIKTFFQILRESKDNYYIGNCLDVEDNPDEWEINKFYRDATEMNQDLGYYAVFDPDEDPDDSNYMTISSHDFYENCYIESPRPEKEYIFLRRKERPNIYCAYHEDEDIHYFYY